MSSALSTAPTLTIVFDGHCLLCSAWVGFLLRHDRDARLRFAAMQGATGQALLAQAGLRLATLDTLLLHDGTRHWCHSAALIRILHTLGGPWRAAWLAWLIPARAASSERLSPAPPRSSTMDCASSTSRARMASCSAADGAMVPCASSVLGILRIVGRHGARDNGCAYEG